MVVPSYNQAYFDYAFITTDAPADLASEFTFEFPSHGRMDDVSANGTAGWLDGSVANIDDIGKVVSRTYQFTLVADYYYIPPKSSTKYPIYHVVITEYGGETLQEAQVEALGYEYVYVETFTPMGDRRFWFHFLPAADLPDGLQYDFSNEIVGPSFSNGLMNWLYDFGLSVYNFFPKVDDMLKTEIMGSSFAWVLTQGFLVYCGWVVIKFVIGVVT